jgi:haloalkane dehalogenase
MPIIRTPDERFAGLPGFPFAPHYAEINGARVHYVDEGEGEVALCLHGEPSWSYLYRKMIPRLSAGHRVIAPDFIGFGRSDKYAEVSEYTYAMHRDTIMGLIEALDLHNITIVVQDWGGLIGLRVVSLMPERFARLVIMNTGLPTGDGPLPLGFLVWRNFAESAADLPVGEILAGGFLHLDEDHPMGKGQGMAAEVKAAYDAPFPGPEFKAGARAFPLLVPATPQYEAAPELKATQTFLLGWQKPCLVMFSDGDPITRGGDLYFRAIVPTAKEQPEIKIKGAGHFLQEDRGEELAGHIVDFLERTPI